LIIKVFKFKSSRLALRGFFIFDSKETELVKIPRYNFVEDLFDNLSCGFKENEALKKRWVNEPLDYIRKNKKIPKGFTEPDSYKIINQAIEYYVLKKLSTHLSGYFNQPDMKRSRLKCYERKDIPDLLLTNSFLELFSKPMNERAAFVEDSYREKNSPGKLIASFKDGVKFEHFELTLPINSKIQKPDDKTLIIDTPRFKLTFNIEFYGFNTNIDKEFKEYYLKYSDDSDLIDYDIALKVNVQFKFKSMFTQAGWNYYAWLDSFLLELDNSFSGKKFFEKLNWETVKTLTTIAKNLIEKNMKK